MEYTCQYASPLGGILLSADEAGLTGLWFEGQRHFPRAPGAAREEKAIFEQAVSWLDLYFSGREPDFTPPLHPTGTEFQLAVWRLLLEIPYGQTTTYGVLARRLAEQRGRVSARAVGGAAGRNPIALLVPCHRVVGADGSLTGYAGGLDRKARLLALEGVALGRSRPETE